ncbi:MAG TPA: thioredoxin domain-containing protein [Chthonomonadaceae bacterium]|nr:thioredoxin domain-containing protein [Chthonomonadaceae bacterium]
MSTLVTPVRESDHTLGPADAPVTLVMYGSYDCPHCRQAMVIVDEIREAGDPIRLIYRHFPRETAHSPSQRAAEAAEAAGKQGKFWEMHRHLLQNQDVLDEANLLAYATAMGLDTRPFAADLENHTFVERVLEDLHSGVAAGVRSTPTFFVNGVRHDDFWDIDTLRLAIEKARLLAMRP